MAIRAIRLAAAVLVSASLFACGGGSGSTPPPPPLVITSTSASPPGGVVGSLYNSPHCGRGGCRPPPFQLSAAGGDRNYRWTWAAAAGSSLPPGLSLAGNLIGGTPLVGSVGSYNVIVTVTDGGTPAAQGSHPYAITIVHPLPPVIAAEEGPQGATLNQPYSYQFQVYGFLPPVTVSETGALPPGLAPLTTTGLLAGTPTSVGSYPITVHAIDAAGQDTAQAFTIGVFQHGFAPTGSMQAIRAYHTATLLASGQVLVTGGQSSYSDPILTPSWLNSSELFTPTNGSFATTGALLVARALHTATLLCDLAALPCTNQKVLVVGGNAAAGTVGSGELYDPTAGTFTLTAGSLATARYSHTATLLLSGKVLIAGGLDANFSALASAELYDPATGTFSTTAAPMANARYSPTATLLLDGRVLIAGGVAASGLHLDSAELYDPVTNNFSTIPSPMTATRAGHTATLLPGGKVLIAGGGDSNGSSVAAAELYDPAAMAPAAIFTATGALVTPRGSPTAVLLPTGQVLVVGGGGGGLPHAELYDPASGLFSSTGGMQAARVNHTLTSLGSSGQVLVVGGGGGPPLNNAELYQ